MDISHVDFFPNDPRVGAQRLSRGRAGARPMEHFLNLLIRSVFLENMALAFFLGMCSFLACSSKVHSAIGLGVAVVFVQALTVPLNNLLLRYLLDEGALAGRSRRCRP